jgi:hypothetical protein
MTDELITIECSLCGGPAGRCSPPAPPVPVICAQCAKLRHAAPRED